MHPWRDRLDRWLSPAVPYWPLSPNETSLAALLLNLMAAVALFGRYFLAAVALVAVGGLFDAMDGIVARTRNEATRFGDFLDHCLDRLSDTFIAGGWLLGNGVQPILAITAIIAIGMNGYIGTQIEATYRERNYDSVGRGEFVLALIVFPIVSSILFRNGWDSWRFAALTIAEWLTLLLIVFAALGVAQRFALARRLDRS